MEIIDGRVIAVTATMIRVLKIWNIFHFLPFDFRDGNDTCPVEDIKKVTAAGGKIDLNLKRTVLEIFLRLAFVIFFFFFW